MKLTISICMMNISISREDTKIVIKASTAQIFEKSLPAFPNTCY